MFICASVASFGLLTASVGVTLHPWRSWTCSSSCLGCRFLSPKLASECCKAVSVGKAHPLSVLQCLAALNFMHIFLYITRTLVSRVWAEQKVLWTEDFWSTIHTQLPWSFYLVVTGWRGVQKAGENAFADSITHFFPLLPHESLYKGKPSFLCFESHEASLVGRNWEYWVMIAVRLVP